MRSARTTCLLLLLAVVATVVAVKALAQPRVVRLDQPGLRERALRSITLNTHAYGVEPSQIDKRSIQITAEENMHIVALEHFIGVGKGSLSDNGHILSTSPDNPWVKWEKAGTGMEATGAKGYFGYCGRDYYTEVDGIDDVMAYESFPAGSHFFVPKGKTLYVHCYAHNFSAESKGYFHHMVRVLYW